MIRGVVLDVDGTVVRGDEPLAGAPAAVADLRAAGLPVVFCSNNPTAGPAAYVDRLGGAGIPVTPAAVVTAATATARYLREHHAGDVATVFGADSVRELLAEATDLRFVADPTLADVVVSTVDESFDYEDMRRAIRTVDEETAFVGTDPDPVIPTADGPAPGSGAITNALAGVLEREPDAVPGKPSATARELVGERLGVPAADLLVVGDRLETDVALGARAGATTALVTTGVADAGDVADASVAPDYVLDSLADVSRVLDAEDVDPPPTDASPLAPGSADAVGTDERRPDDR
ncbi:HAD-IIA family hydrolase [Halobaculum sp. MBLA0147]|uniref:HAD-IIA family hydrolase n=1 Tax=Halobaculum sp. MBLA0147 TaxID=3079934 RepID=UPI003523B4AF